MKNKLELLALAKDFEITKGDEEYEVSCNTSGLTAFINLSGKTKYYVSDVYNCGINFAEINMEALRKLEAFCRLMTD